MSLTHISMIQALGIWSELDDALHGQNAFGSTEAEIYAYRLQSCSPLLMSLGTVDGETQIDREVKDQQATRARDALVELCLLFAQERYATVKIAGLTPRAWAKRIGTNFDHRVVVSVSPRPARGGR